MLMKQESTLVDTSPKADLSLGSMQPFNRWGPLDSQGRTPEGMGRCTVDKGHF